MSLISGLHCIVLDPPCNDPVLQTSNIVDQYPEVFKHDITKVATHVSHRILWKPDAKPVQHKVRNIPLAVRPAVAKELQRLQDEGYIEPFEASEWVSPIVVAHKPDGPVRLCIDLHDVNSKIIVERYPMPNIHKMLSALESAKVFTTIDLSSVYHQIPLTDESKDITTFITTEGLFRFTWIPFGLASASPVFQRMMHKIFKDLKAVFLKKLLTCRTLCPTPRDLISDMCM